MCVVAALYVRVGASFVCGVLHVCDVLHACVGCSCVCDVFHVCVGATCVCGVLHVCVGVSCALDTFHRERWGAGVETQKNVRGEIGGWGRVPFNEPYAPSLSTIYDGA